MTCPLCDGEGVADLNDYRETRSYARHLQNRALSRAPRPEEKRHDALDVRLHCGYIEGMRTMQTKVSARNANTLLRLTSLAEELGLYPTVTQLSKAADAIADGRSPSRALDSAQDALDEAQTKAERLGDELWADKIERLHVRVAKLAAALS
jgi:hypothetical protein